MAELIVPVILAGGQGSRLWPMSRSARPKQFLPLTGPESLFQETLRRVADPARYHPPVILTNSDYRFLVAEQALEAGAERCDVLLEPVARSTAAAIAAAAAFVTDKYGQSAVLHVLPSDQRVAADADYARSVDVAAAAARGGALVTFGIAPTAPETGYGYIERGAARPDGLCDIVRFVEKPDRATAERMLADGRFSWNSGMFMLPAEGFLKECDALAPEVSAAARASVAAAKRDLDFVRIDEAAFASSPSISVDYAIFEKTRAALVLPVAYGWSDLGTWGAVWNAADKDGSGNVTSGPVTLNDAVNALVVSDRAHVALDGLTDVAVIATEDAVYVGQLSRSQNVSAIVRALKDNVATADLTHVHKTAYRPWGGYSALALGERFQVKRLFVKPGKRLSLQRHHHRAEHWVVVRGTADVTIDGNTVMLSENQSCYLPQGCVHRLANPGKIDLEIIEVQTGAYLGEDDIVRLEDEFGRA